MATTYKDMTGRVFPLNMSGKPQGYFDGNKFVFPQFKRTTAAAIPAVDPVMPVVQQPDYFRLPASTRQMLSGGPDMDVPVDDMSDVNLDTSRYGEMDAPASQFGSMNLGPSIGSTIGSGLFGTYGGPVGSVLGGLATGRGNRGIAGDFVGGLLGIPLGPLGMIGLGALGGKIGDSLDAAAAGMPDSVFGVATPGYFPDFESFDNPGAFETVDTPFGDPFQAIADAMQDGDDDVGDIGADVSDYTGFGFGEDDGFGMV